MSMIDNAIERKLGAYLTPRSAAHLCVGRDWEVVPAIGKVPAISWKDGGLSTHDEVDREWTLRPTANVAIVTGPSGLVVIDFDRVDWRAALRSLERELGPLDAAVAITGSGGAHLYTRHPEGDPIATRAPLRIEGVEIRGVDIRAHGGIVIAPGSTHPTTGAAYEWAPFGSVPPETIPVLPDAWHRALTWTAPAVPATARTAIPIEGDRARRYALAALERECSEVACTPAGGRNERLHRAATALGSLRALDENEITTALDSACASWGRRDASKDRQTIRRGIAYGAAHPRENRSAA